MSANKSNRKRPRSKSKRDSNSGNIIIVGIALVLLAVYINWVSSQPTEPLAGKDIITLGEQVYKESCAACHGEQGEGHAALAQAPALDDSEHAWHHADGQLQELINIGGVDMPSFSDKLSNEEVIAVIRYFQTFWRADQVSAQQAKSAENPMQD